MKRHVLLTAWAFPPARTSGVHRAVGIANAFADRGWDVTVLTTPVAVFAANGIVDPSLEGLVDRRVRVERVPFSSYHYDTDITDWSWWRARHPELWNGSRLSRERRVFPEPGFGLWKAALERAALTIHAEHPVDVAIGTANPHVDFVPGAVLGDRGVFSVMDYRDAWTVDVFTGEDRATATDRERAVERRLLSRADLIWFVNEPIRAWHAARHPHAAPRMRVVPNGFDVVDGLTPAVPWRTPSTPLTFGYVGTINHGQFPAEALFAGWRLARQRDPLLSESRLILRGHLGRTGIAGEELSRLLDDAASDGVGYGGPVAKADLSGVYAGFDALVLALASGPGVTSGKVFEFAATGLPVLSVHDPDSAATAIMRDSPVWTPVGSVTPDAVAEGLSATARRVRAQTGDIRAQAIEWGARWERGRQLAAGVDEIDARVSERIG